MIVLVSGGFDPCHKGHVRLLLAASEYGYVIVALNSDEWLIRKKGYAFMTWDERAEILRSMRMVSAVAAVDDSDGTVCDALRNLQVDIFVNGGDRVSANGKEHDVCAELGIREIFGAGGGKVQSSSELINELVSRLR